MLGNGRIEAQCFDGEKRLAHIRGKMRKKVCVCTSVNSVVSSMVMWHLRCGSIRETLFYFPWEISKTAKQMSSSNIPLMRLVIVCVFVFYYEICTPSDLRHSVKAYGELPENAKINETDTFGEEDGDCIFDFGDEGEVDIDDIWMPYLVYERFLIVFWFFVVLLYLYWWSLDAQEW